MGHHKFEILRKRMQDTVLQNVDTLCACFPILDCGINFKKRIITFFYYNENQVTPIVKSTIKSRLKDFGYEIEFVKDYK